MIIRWVTGTLILAYIKRLSITGFKLTHLADGTCTGSEMVRLVCVSSYHHFILYGNNFTIVRSTNPTIGTKDNRLSNRTLPVAFAFPNGDQVGCSLLAITIWFDILHVCYFSSA